MKRYSLTLVGIVLILGITLGLTFMFPTTHAHGIESSSGSQPNPKGSGTTRTYYIAADEVEWDYAPSGINQITGEDFDDDANVFVANGPDR